MSQGESLGLFGVSAILHSEVPQSVGTLRVSPKYQLPRPLFTSRDSVTQRVLCTVMGDIFPNHNMSSYYRSPTFSYIGTLDPLGKTFWPFLSGCGR